MSTSIPKHVLPVIVIAQLFCTSLWFAGNGVAFELGQSFDMDDAIGPITWSVQIGFIIGTLLFAMLKIADRFSPSRVFMLSAIFGAAANVTIVWMDQSFELLTLRFVTGFCLAGIYPVGMKIAADYHQKGLGVALGYLVGALVLGTASTHLLRLITVSQPWQQVIYGTSALSIVGGLLLGLLVPDGPYRRKSPELDFIAFVKVFSYRRFRGAALGYFGHMWELYAFWAFVPVYIQLYISQSGNELSTSLVSFSTIAIGGLGCVLGGYYSLRIGSEKVAFSALIVSFLCLVFSPWALLFPPILFVAFLLIWGMAVITDSPQFSNTAAANAPPELTGTALTIMNSIGFAITLGSISLLNQASVQPFLFWWLIPGPMIGLILFWLHSLTKDQP